MHVLVVDDEVRMVELVTGYLTEAGFTAEGCHDGPTALEVVARGSVEVLVLDLMLPGMDGLAVCRQVRAQGVDVPILMLTARGAVPERVAGLEAGADDYLVKPFALEELVARLRALGRRREPPERRLRVGQVVLDDLEKRLWVADEPCALPRREFAMLAELMRNAGRVVSRQHLFDALWDGEVDIRSNALEVHMSRLRPRLGAASGVTITTVRGFGYRLESAAGE